MLTKQSSLVVSHLGSRGSVIVALIPLFAAQDTVHNIREITGNVTFFIIIIIIRHVIGELSLKKTH